MLAQIKKNDQRFNQATSQQLDQVKLLKGQAQDFGHEVRRQNDMIDGMKDDVDEINNKVLKLDSRLDKFVANTDDKKVCWYIAG